MSAFSLCPNFGIFYQGFDDGGKVLNGGLLYSYQAGTTTPLDTYTDVSGATANTNPIVFGSDGRPPSQIWLNTAYWYRFVLMDSLGNTIRSFDNTPSSSATVTLPGGSTSGGPLNQVSTTPTLVFTVQPSNVSQISIMSPAVQVSLTNGAGIVIYSYTGNITLAMGTGSSVLGGTTTVAAVNGVSTFSDLTLSLVESGDTLVASATGMVGATSNTFDVTAIVYSSTAHQTFDSSAAGIGAVLPWSSTAERFPSGYGDTVFIVMNQGAAPQYADTTFWRVDQNAGTIAQYQVGNGTVTNPVSSSNITEGGEIYFRPYASTGDLYKQDPDGTLKYFSTATTSDSGYGLIQGTRGLGNEFVGISNSYGARHYSSINWIAHTATDTAVTDATNTYGEPSKQYANIVNNRCFTYVNGGSYMLGYYDLSSNKIVGVVPYNAPTAPVSTSILNDVNGNFYGSNGNTKVYKWDAVSGALLGTATLTGTYGGGSVSLGCVTDDGYVWVQEQNPFVGLNWWKVAISTMTVSASGTLALHSGSLNWKMAIGTRFSDQTSPLLFISNAGTVYLGKMVSV